MSLETKMLFFPFTDSQEEMNQESEVEAFLDAAYGDIEEVTDNSKIGFKTGPKLYKKLASRFDVINGNDRAYPRKIGSSAIQRWKQENPEGTVGQEGHPQSFKRPNGKLGWKEEIEKKCIKVVDILDADSAGNVYCIFHTLNTQRGRDLQAAIDAGDKFGLSIRAGGYGKVGTINGKKVNIAQYMDINTIDVVFDPALYDTYGAPEPITDSQIDEALADGEQAAHQDYSDAVDPFIQQLRDAKTLTELVKIKDTVSKEALDSVDRRAFDSAYYERYGQISELMWALQQEQSNKSRVGFVDSQDDPNHEEEEDKMKYTLSALRAMTDAQLNQVKTTEPDYSEMCDAVISERAQAAELETLRKERQQREDQQAAQAFLDSQDVQEKLNRLPANIRSKVTEKIDLTNADSAQRTFTDAYDMACSLSADLKLGGLGFDTTNQNGEFRAKSNVEVGENKGWMAITDSLKNETVAQAKRNSGFDTHTAKVNEHLVKDILAEFDEANVEQLSRYADSMDSSTTTMSVLNGVIFYRNLIEQVFQTLVAAHYCEVGTFSGQWAKIPVERYVRVNNGRTTRNGEMRAMARGKLNVGYIDVFAEARKLAAELSIEVETFLKSGPIQYDALARINYHLGEDLKREVSLDMHNEMLLASDEYNAVVVTGEVSDINADRTVVTLLRGGASGSPNRYVPIVRPRRKVSPGADGGAVVTYDNEISLTVGSTVIDLSTAVIDYENGTITFENPLPAGNLLTSYKYVTNIALFDLNPGDLEYSHHMNKVIHLLGNQKAQMGQAPNFYPPNFGLMSQVLSNEISEARSFEAWAKKNGTELQPNGWVAKIKDIDLAEHNEPWNAGDSRLLIGQRMATKYAIETNVTMRGPVESRDETGEINGGQEFYLFTNDALKTPIPQKLRTIKFYNSAS